MERVTLKERIGHRRRNAEIRRLTFVEWKDAKEIVIELQERWPAITKWTVYNVLRSYRNTVPDGTPRQKVTNQNPSD